MSHSVRHTLIVKDTNHCGSNKQDKRRANHKVRRFNKPHIDDVRELWKLDNDKADGDAYYSFISAKVDSMTQKIIILNKNYANNSIYKETNALNTLIVGKNTVGTNIEIGKAYNKH